MADARVKIAKDKAELVQALKNGSDVNWPFQTYADVIAFAAALGSKSGKRIPVKEVSVKDPDPVPHDQFKSKYVMDLIVISEVRNLKVLLVNEVSAHQRIEIFQ